MSVGTRIIGGQLRGAEIGPLPKHIVARPILARIKKSLFDILRNRISESQFLDLFSGSGTVGFEALSRGAAKVIFVDKSPHVQKWINGTLKRWTDRNQNLFRNQEYMVHCADIMNGLGWLNQRFDIIFSGAPYVDQERKALFFISELLAQMERDKLLKPNGWFIAQHQAKEVFDVPKTWEFFRQEEYGDSKLSFFRIKPTDFE